MTALVGQEINHAHEIAISYTPFSSNELAQKEESIDKCASEIYLVRFLATWPHEKVKDRGE